MQSLSSVILSAEVYSLCTDSCPPCYVFRLINVRWLYKVTHL